MLNVGEISVPPPPDPENATALWKHFGDRFATFAGFQKVFFWYLEHVHKIWRGSRHSWRIFWGGMLNVAEIFCPPDPENALWKNFGARFGTFAGSIFKTFFSLKYQIAVVYGIVATQMAFESVLNALKRPKIHFRQFLAQKQNLFFPHIFLTSHSIYSPCVWGCIG